MHAGLHKVLAAIALAATGCASVPPRHYNVVPLESRIAPDIVASSKEWGLKRGIYNSVSYGPDSVSFTYGNPEMRTLGYDEFQAFVREQISDQTIANASRPNLRDSDNASFASVTYMGGDGSFAQWTRETPKPIAGRWYFFRTTEDEIQQLKALGSAGPPLAICFDYDVGEATATDQCYAQYDFVTGIHGKRDGDVFKLQSGAAPELGAWSTDPHWPDGTPLFPKKASHD